MRFILFCFLLFAGNLFSQNWKSIITSFSTNQNEGLSIDLHHGKQYFAGVYEGSMNIGFNTVTGISQNDIFFGKASLTGNTEWLRSINGTAIDRLSNILCYEDKILISGTFQDSLFVGTDTLVNTYQGSTFIAYFDTLGNYLYTFHPDVFSANMMDYDFDSQGKLLITGKFYQHFNYGNFSMVVNTGENFFLIKYDPVLDSIVWSVQSSGTVTAGENLYIDTNDDILVTGYYNDGTFFIDTLLNTGNINHNMYVVKVDTDGNRDWITTIEGTGEVHGYGIACDASNNVYAVGEYKGVCDVQAVVHTSNGSFDAIAVKYNSNGTRMWSEGIGGPNSDEGYGVVVDDNGDPIFMLAAGVDPVYQGQTLYTHGFKEPLLLKIRNTDASLIWDQRLYATQTSGQVSANSIAIDGNFIAMTGNNITGIEFNSSSYPSANNKDFYSVILEDSLTYHLNIDEIQKDNFSVIYPNPSSNLVTISSSKKIKRIVIFDIKGNQIKNLFVTCTRTTVNVHDFKPGVYFIQVMSDHVFETHKLVKTNY